MVSYEFGEFNGALVAYEAIVDDDSGSVSVILKLRS